MDLAYGRYDDATFNLDINAGPAARVALNRYNPCIAQVGTLAADVVCDPNLLQGPWDSISGNATRTWNQIASGAHQTPYGTDRDKTIEPGRQPRMPWQDVHCLIVGPAVSDVTLNFVLRWNAIIEHLESTDELAWTRLVGCRRPHPELADTYPKPGTCSVQVLRSAPRLMRLAEHSALTAPERTRFPRPDMAQHDILKVMRNLIDKAQYFIYVENQFFQSAFGQEAVCAESGPAAEVKDKDMNGFKAWLASPAHGAEHPI